jgi:hypothetical protein
MEVEPLLAHFDNDMVTIPLHLWHRPGSVLDHFRGRPYTLP